MKIGRKEIERRQGDAQDGEPEKDNRDSREIDRWENILATNVSLLTQTQEA